MAIDLPPPPPPAVANDLPPPPLPGMCCMSGCANCVWIQYAEELVNLYHNSEAAKKAIENIPDENMKAFLKIDLGIKWDKLRNHKPGMGQQLLCWFEKLNPAS